MPVEKIPRRRVGITVIPGRVRIEVGKRFGPRERAALRGIFAALARAPLAEALEEQGGWIGAELAALGFPQTLGFYEADDPEKMAEHARLRIDAGLQVYFCDPRSPWQRGTNENTDGLLRRYFPKGTDLRGRGAQQQTAQDTRLEDARRSSKGRAAISSGGRCDDCLSPGWTPRSAWCTHPVGGRLLAIAASSAATVRRAPIVRPSA